MAADDSTISTTTVGDAVKRLISTKSVFSVDKVSRVNNRDITQQSFSTATTKTNGINSVLSDEAVSSVNLSRLDQLNRKFNSAVFKWKDTSMGGSFAINPKPQYTRYADVREKGRLSGRVETEVNTENGQVGMGRYYSEAIDDNAQTIHMRFGVPEFNSLTTFFSGFYNAESGMMAKTGRSSSAAFTIGKIASTVISVFSVPLLAIRLVAFGVSLFKTSPDSKFYYLKPTMPLYWNAVNSIVNNIAISKGLIPKLPWMNNDTAQTVGDLRKFDSADMALIAQNLPGIFNPNTGIDVYTIAAKAKRLQRQNIKLLEDAYDNDNSSDAAFQGFVKKQGQTILTDPGDNGKGKVTIGEALTRWFSSSESKPPTEENSEINMSGKKYDKDGKIVASEPGFLAQVGEYLMGEWDDGTAFASFNVDYTGPASEAFSNAVAESELANKINGMSAANRSRQFSFAGGNLIGGVVGDVFEGIKDLAVGAIDGLGVGGLLALGGNAFVDMPKHWQSSTASLPRATYTISLRSPYGNPVSQMQNIYIPLAMLLAGVLPLSTGKASYSSPFICELYDQGRTQTRLGMIDSLAVTRGVGNLGFDKNGNAMGIDVSFSVVDLSTIIHMPINQGWGTVMGEGIFDSATSFSDYMAVLGAMNLDSQIYATKRWTRNIQNLYARATTSILASPAHMAMYIKDFKVVGWVDIFFKGAQR